MLCPKCNSELAVTEKQDKCNRREGNTYICDIRVMYDCTKCKYFRLEFKKLTQTLNINQ